MNMSIKHITSFDIVYTKDEYLYAVRLGIGELPIVGEAIGIEVVINTKDPRASYTDIDTREQLLEDTLEQIQEAEIFSDNNLLNDCEICEQIKVREHINEINGWKVCISCEDQYHGRSEVPWMKSDE
jgi:hypothetical protein